MRFAASFRSAVSSTSTGALPGPTPKGRIAGAVGGLDHRWPAGRHDQIDALVGHQLLDQRDVGFVDHLHGAIGRARGLGGFGQHARGIGAAGLGCGMGLRMIALRVISASSVLK